MRILNINSRKTLQGKRILAHNHSDVLYKLRSDIETMNDEGSLSNQKRLELIQKLTEAEEHYLKIESIIAAIQQRLKQGK